MKASWKLSVAIVVAVGIFALASANTALAGHGQSHSSKGSYSSYNKGCWGGYGSYCSSYCHSYCPSYCVYPTYCEPVCYEPAPVCYQPAPVCCEPAPVCCEPAPVCYEPAPVCYEQYCPSYCLESCFPYYRDHCWDSYRDHKKWDHDDHKMKHQDGQIGSMKQRHSNQSSNAGMSQANRGAKARG